MFQRKKIILKVLSFALTAITCISLYQSYTLAARDTKLDSISLVKQSASDTCTLASATNMLRRRACWNGGSYTGSYTHITEADVGTVGWGAAGLNSSFTYNGFSVTRSADISSLTAAQVSTTLKNMLDANPEGIVVWGPNMYVYGPHAVLLTGYVGDTFYAYDPANSAVNGITTLEGTIFDGTQTTILNNLQRYWSCN